MHSRECNATTCYSLFHLHASDLYYSEKTLSKVLVTNPFGEVDQKADEKGILTEQSENYLVYIGGRVYI